MDTTRSTESSFRGGAVRGLGWKDAPTVAVLLRYGSRAGVHPAHNFGSGKNVTSMQRRMQASTEPNADQLVNCLSHFHHVHRGASQFRPRAVRQHRNLRPVQLAQPGEIDRPTGLRQLVDMDEQSFQFTALSSHEYQQLHVTVSAEPIHSALQSAIHRPRIESQSRFALSSETNIFLRAIFTASMGARGWHPSNSPSRCSPVRRRRLPRTESASAELFLR